MSRRGVCKTVIVGFVVGRERDLHVKRDLLSVERDLRRGCGRRRGGRVVVSGRKCAQIFGQ